MPLIYIPEEAAAFANDRRRLPQNQIMTLVALIEKKLSVKVQNNLAQFKLDLQILRKAVASLKAEQAALATKPVQQILGGCKGAL